MDPATAAALASLTQSIVGTKEIAGMAPAYDASTGQIGMLDNEFAPEDLGGDGGLAAILAQYFQPSESTDTVGAEVAGLPLPTDTPEIRAAESVPDWFREGSGGVDAGLPNNGLAGGTSGDAGSLEWFKNATNENLANTPSAEVPNFLGGLGEMAGGFFGNMDQNMQSPSKTLGMGLLGQIDPRLGYAGLLSMGLFGKNKLFGK